MGQALLAKSGKASSAKAFLADIIREWDVNQDGKVSLIEWRQNVRRLLNRKQELDMKQVDSSQ